MKKLIIALSSTLLVSTCFLASNRFSTAKADSLSVVSTNGCKSGTLPTALNLNKCSEEEIRNYYSSLNSLDSSKKSGIKALQYLKPILFEMNYFTYAQVSDIYAITDRDWTNSPTLSSGTFNSASNTVTGFSSSKEADSNPYINMLYVDYTVESKTPLHKSNGNANFDKEHVWCQSRGFKADSGAKGPAGTDLHHLIAGDSYVNESIHNNNPYGFVANTEGKGNRESTKWNLKGTQKHTSAQDQATTVFEPCDEWKGDVARAIFYMMARYNNVSGKETITDFEPNLTIVNYATSNGAAEKSSASSPVSIGILSDLLAWNKIDPVSEFEIYRNDLIYRNYQGNRNPFIDYPQWIDAIWGTASEDGTNYDSNPVGFIDPQKDEINGFDQDLLKVNSGSIKLNLNGTTTLKATTNSSSNISWSVKNSSVISLSKSTSLSGEEIAVTALAEGQTSITAKVTVEDKEYARTISVVVTDPSKKDDETEFKLKPIYIVAIGIAAIISLVIGIVSKKSSKKTKKRKKKSRK